MNDMRTSGRIYKTDFSNAFHTRFVYNLYFFPSLLSGTYSLNTDLFFYHLLGHIHTKESEPAINKQLKHDVSGALSAALSCHLPSRVVLLSACQNGHSSQVGFTPFQ